MLRITFVFLFACALVLSIAGAAGAQQTTIEVVVTQDMVPEAEIHTSFRGEFQQSEPSAKRKSGDPVVFVGERAPESFTTTQAAASSAVLVGVLAFILMTAARILLRSRLAPRMVAGFTT